MKTISIHEYVAALLKFIADNLAEHGWSNSIEMAEEKFVERELNFELRAVGDLLLQARSHVLIQAALDTDRGELHSGRLNHEQNISTGHHYEMLRRDACGYNHQLRGFIEAHRDDIDRDELVAWLATASGGRRDWANGEVTGAMSEIALHAALMGLPELVNLRYGTLDEDLHGYDFVAEWQGKELTIDAKTGLFHPLTEMKHGHEHLQLSVPKELIEGFFLTRHGLDVLRHDVRRALRYRVGADIHQTHGIYTANTKTAVPVV